MTIVRAHYPRSCYPDASNEVIVTAGRFPDRTQVDPIAQHKPMIEHDEWDCVELEEAQLIALNLGALHGVRVELE